MTAKAPVNTGYYATGRRKTASARVYMQRGSGKIEVNGLTLDAYFGGLLRAKILVQKPLYLVEMKDSFDLRIFVKGSGPFGQAGAISHGISRALVAFDEAGMRPAVPHEQEDEAKGGKGDIALTVRQKLRKAGCLTRDARKVERKKVGYRKARKVEQYSKR
jgi:small subunit ribosomal protein S9